MKKFKILHLPTAKYVWEYAWGYHVKSEKFDHTILICRDEHDIKAYLSAQLWVCDNLSSDDILLFDYKHHHSNTPFMRHEFEIIEVEDEEV